MGSDRLPDVRHVVSLASFEHPEVGKWTRVAIAAEEIEITVKDCGVVTGTRLRHDTSLHCLDPGRRLAGEIERPQIVYPASVSPSISRISPFASLRTRAGLERAAGLADGVRSVQVRVAGLNAHKSPWGQGPNPEEQPP
jgi:hypothetical protein